jgi:Ethanolamine utilization protein EutJ (predicted chaperonin)
MMLCSSAGLELGAESSFVFVVRDRNDQPVLVYLARATMTNGSVCLCTSETVKSMLQRLSI